MYDLTCGYEMPLQLPVALSWIDQVPDRYAVDAEDSCPLPPQEVTNTSAIEQTRTADELRTVTLPRNALSLIDGALTHNVVSTVREWRTRAPTGAPVGGVRLREGLLCVLRASG